MLLERGDETRPTLEGNDQLILTKAAAAEGSVVVLLAIDREGGGLKREQYIRARLFSDTLVPQGNDFAINTLLTGLQRNPKVGDYGRAGFFVVWESEFSVGDDSDEKSIQGRIVAGANQFDGAQFQVNDSTAGHQETPGIGGRNDRIGIAWRSWGVGIPYTIVGQSWSVCGIFCDGFEGGDD